ncbi:hypothetical protein BaRGS_00040446 [Batillaria attramentaria]|uniref:Glutathione S-transferase n=1 Tax=Batillaria attramentaria TaxID=370345 RepID=A0ABD0J052_9CAEN
MAQLKYYYDLMSQPSRALYMFLKLNKIPFEEKPVALRKGEHKTEEYKKIHPFHLVPALHDGDFKLTESLAIVEYLMSTQNAADHWLPRTDARKRAKLIIPRATGKPVDQEKVKKGRENVKRVVKDLESYFLKDTPFLSSNEITVADIFGACELMQLYAVLEEGLYESSPIVKAWMARVRERTNPQFDEANVMVYRVRDMYKKLAKL